MQSFHSKVGVCRGFLLVVLAIFLSVASQAQSAPRKTDPAPAKNATKPASAPTGHVPDTQAGDHSVLAQLNGDLERLAAKVSPAVVQILVTGYGPLKEEDRSQTALIVRQHAVGSGVIVDPNGYIMTNAHVVEGAQRIRVALPLPMRRLRAARYRSGSVASWKRNLSASTKIPTLRCLRSTKRICRRYPLISQQRPQVGQLVFAIGSPEGLQNSVTMGVLSALARQPDSTKPLTYLQTDAPINPGNSGGPLVDMNGAVVGINTFILSQGGGSEGLGFAIPSRVVDFVYHSLRQHGHVHRVEIGAVAQEITPDLAEGLQLPAALGRRRRRREAETARQRRPACRFKTSF